MNNNMELELIKLENGISAISAVIAEYSVQMNTAYNNLLEELGRSGFGKQSEKDYKAIQEVTTKIQGLGMQIADIFAID